VKFSISIKSLLSSISQKALRVFGAFTIFSAIPIKILISSFSKPSLSTVKVSLAFSTAIDNLSFMSCIYQLMALVSITLEFASDSISSILSSSLGNALKNLYTSSIVLYIASNCLPDV